MKKITIARFSMLAILLLSLLPLALLFGTESAEGLIVSMQWGHLNQNDYDGDEKDLEEDVSDYIYWLFYSDILGSWSPVNAWWVYTDDDYVDQVLGWENDNSGVSFCTNWWVGDYHASGYPYIPGPYGHLWFYGHNNDDISDYALYDYATNGGTISSKQNFNFIWTCVNGGYYWKDSQGNYDLIEGIMTPAESPGPPNPTNTNDEYGFFYYGDAVGMPLAWTGTSNMYLNGFYWYSGDYCYIGFEGQSPFMKNYLPETQVQAYNFALDFYEAALGYHSQYYQHQSIHNSLVYASWNTFGCSYQDSPFYDGYWVYTPPGEPVEGYWFCHMRVLGNGNMLLPYS
jgi:hypothetical protein